MMPKPRLAFLLLLCVSHFLTPGAAKNNNLYREYIGALFNNVTFSDVPINPHVQFHFILSFAIDYTNLTSPLPTNGEFGIFWDASNLSPAHVLAIKKRHPNVKVAVSIGGDSVGGLPAYFNITTEDSWVSNAVQSLTKIIKLYHLDGVDVDYEHFRADPQTFARCVGRLIQTLKATKTISSASIAPYDDNPVQNHYLALWKSYGHLIDFVNFQFYAYDNSTTVRQFLGYYRNQTLNYKGGKVLVSFESDEQRGLTPKTGFFVACEKLKKRGQLYGIFTWCADASKPQGFVSEIRSQSLLAQL